MASKLSQPGVAAIVAAALLPPLGVFLAQGITPSFWLAVALTCLGFVLVALFTVLRPRFR